MAIMISSIVMTPSPDGSPAAQETEKSPSAMLTIVMISSTVTCPSLLQAPGHCTPGVLVALAGTVAVCVGVPVAVSVAVGVTDAVGVCVDVDVAVPVRLGDAVGVSVASGVSVAVGVGVKDAVGVDVDVDVAVAVRLGDAVGVSVAVGVGVGDGVNWSPKSLVAVLPGGTLTVTRFGVVLTNPTGSVSRTA